MLLPSFIPALAAITIGVGIPGIVPSPEVLIRQGMEEFAKGDVTSSINLFTRVESIENRYAPFLWQKGIAEYYADEFKACSDQFALDLSVNKDDTEEVLWKYLCDSRLEAESRLSQGAGGGMVGEGGQKLTTVRLLPQRVADPRPIMQLAYTTFSGATGPSTLEDAGTAAGRDSPQYFYSRLYLSLYYESKGDVDSSGKYMLEALGGGYGDSSRSRDFMVFVAQQHALKRGLVPKAASAVVRAAKI
jgi:hypothetical protein